jgi:large subunit ribosomal protein L25
MATTSDTSSLSVASREASGSRAARRLRRAGNVPGVIYGGNEAPVTFQVGALTLRNTLAHAGAVLELSLDDSKPTPVMVKELVRHPVTGEIQHVDLLRVRMDVRIQSTVILDLVGAESAPGVRDGGVLEQVAREVTIEALPGDIPDSIQHDVSDLEAGATLTLSEIRAPANVALVDDPETVVATITAPRLVLESETEIEQETELVGEAGEGEAAEAADSEAAAEGEAAEGASSEE